MVEGRHNEEGLMTHKQALPAAGTPPYPAHPAPRAEQVGVAAYDDETSPSPGKAPAHRAGVIGAVVGIGSAAVVVALLHARGRKG
jgi:hypothetical protein